MNAKLQDASKVSAPAVINVNDLVDMGVYLIEFQLDDQDPEAGFWRMKALHAGGYWFAASDRDHEDGPMTVRWAEYTVLRHLKASRLTLADFQAPSPHPSLFGRVVGGRGGAYCDRRQRALPPAPAEDGPVWTPPTGTCGGC